MIYNTECKEKFETFFTAMGAGFGFFWYHFLHNDIEHNDTKHDDTEHIEILRSNK